MTEKIIGTSALFHGLAVMKRITTGNDKAHFATFELTGAPDQVQAAWTELSKHARKDFDSLRRVNNHSHPDYGALYIECDSVWCD